MRKIFTTLFICCFFAVGLPAQKQYKRIVSLAPSLTQSLYYLEAQEILIGCTSYCTAAKKDNKTVVASAVKPNLEKIISLNPDLVIAGGFTAPEDIETLKKFGIRVEIFMSPKSFQEICDQFVQLGTLIGEKEKASDIVTQSRQKVNTISEKRRGKKKPKMFFQIGANPLFAVIPNTFMDDYMRFLGGRNIAEKLNRGSVGREFVIAGNPDYIFIATMGIVGEDEKKTWGRYSNLSAAKKKNIHIIDSEIACQPTPVTFVETMEVLDKIVNK